MARPTEIVEVELAPGVVIDAEVVVAEAGGDVSAWDRLPLEEAQAAIQRISRWVVGSMRAGLPERPDRWGVEFGVKLGVKTGKLTSILAEAAGEASIVAHLEWDHHDPGPGGAARP